MFSNGLLVMFIRSSQEPTLAEPLAVHLVGDLSHCRFSLGKFDKRLIMSCFSAAVVIADM